MVNKTPWTVEGNPWGNEAKFITWVRGILRKGWSKHPLKIEYIKRNKKRIANTNTKSAKTHPTVWGMKCECCGKDTLQAEIEIDHKGTVQGRFTTMAEIEGYARHLYMIDYESIQSVCKPCHSIISYSQKHNLTFTEAAREKHVIDICKQPVKEVLAFLEANGHNTDKLTNAAKRREAVTQVLRSVE